MKKASEELKKLRLLVEKSLNKTDGLYKVLDQIESTIIRAEDQKNIVKKSN